MRVEQSKLTTVKALQSIGFETIASGDSYNDLGMIQASKAGFLFRSTDKIKADYPQIPAYETYEELLGAIKKQWMRSKQKGDFRPEAATNGQENRNMGFYYMRRRIQVEAEKPQFCVTTGITFAQADAWFGNTVQDLKLDLIYPRDNTRKYPCVVWICGGAWIQMDRSAHLAYLSVLAHQGFVVASVEYRTSNEANFRHRCRM